MRRAVVVLVAATMVLGACGHKQEPAEGVRPVQTLAIGQSRESVGATYSGAVTARFQSSQGFRVTGTIQKRLVEVGQHVVAGQALLQLDPTQLDLNRQAARAQLDAARSQAAQAKVSLGRDAELVRQNFISQAEYDRDKVNYDTATAQLQAAQAQYAQATNQADYATLRAAATGIVTTMDAEVGQVVDTGKAVITIAADGDREVVVDVPESRVDQLRDAQGLYVTLWADPGKRYPARLREIDPDTDPTTRTYDAHITVLKPDAAMLLGMTAYVHMPNAGQESASALPLTAIVETGNGTAVWLVDPKASTVSLHPVKLLTVRNNDALVESGLKDGDVVVTAGANLLHAGQKVRAVGTYSQRGE